MGRVALATVTAAIAAAALALPASAATTVTVTMTDYHFALSASPVPRGVVVFKLTNALTTKTEPADKHALDHRLKYAWKLAKRKQAWKALDKASRTVAGSPALRNASRQLAKAM